MPTISKVLENLDAVIKFNYVDWDFWNYYTIIKEVCQEIIKKQFKKIKLSTFGISH